MISECENGRTDPYPIPTCLAMNVIPQRSLQKPGLVKISKSKKIHREMVKIIFEEQKEENCRSTSVQFTIHPKGLTNWESTALGAFQLGLSMNIGAAGEANSLK